MMLPDLAIGPLGCDRSHPASFRRTLPGNFLRTADSMNGNQVERRLAAILAADVAAYSRLMGQDEVGTLARLKALRRELIDPQIAEHKGRLVKTTGDGLLVEFQSVVEAVACGVAIQRGITKRNAAIPDDQRIEFRVGIHHGDIIVEDGDIFGDGVNLAARLEGLAEPGGICVSRVVHDEIRDKLDFAFEDLGEQQVKNIVRPVHVFAVRLDDAAPARPVEKPPLPLPEKPSLVVLPFQNMSGDPEQEYFADGMVEEITTAITRFPWLSVIARNSAFTYKGRAVEVKQVARELGVRYVLEGSVRKAGSRVRITGQLIDAATAAHIWADRFDGALDDVFDLQDQVAASVVGAIEPKLRQSEIDRAVRKPATSLDAYDLYLRGTAEYNKRTRDGHTEAIRLLRQALERDPAYGPAMARIANCRLMQLARRWIPAAGPEIEEGIRIARQAIAAGRDDPEVLWIAGYALGYLAGENQTALEALDRAIMLNPNLAHAFGSRAMVLLWLNRLDEAIASAQHAILLSPHHQHTMVSYTALAGAHATAGRYEEALIWADRALRENSGVPALRIKLSVLGYLGWHEEAEKCLRLLREIHPQPTIAGMMRDVPKGLSPERAAFLAEGLRKAGMPEE
jgi:TolB-like protein/class 3 adenylate cyclase